MRASYLFTSESVSEGHPDKVCDRISDEIVDLFFREVIARFGEIAAVPKLFVFDGNGTRTHTFYGAPPDLHQKIESAVSASVR